MRKAGIARVPGDVVIAARHQLTIFWGVCIAVLTLGIIVAWGNQPTMTGKIEGAAFLGFFIALIVFLWWYRNRLRPRIQVTSDEIRYWHQGRHLQFTIGRQPAGQRSWRSPKAIISPCADQLTAWTSGISRRAP